MIPASLNVSKMSINIEKRGGFFKSPLQLFTLIN